MTAPRRLRRSSAGGDQNAAEGIGISLWGPVWRAGSIYGELAEWRIQWWRRLELGWPTEAPATSFAAAGARGRAGTRLRWPWRCAISTYGVYVVR